MFHLCVKSGKIKFYRFFFEIKKIKNYFLRKLFLLNLINKIKLNHNICNLHYIKRFRKLRHENAKKNY
jgi:hypothetical protein